MGIIALYSMGINDGIVLMIVVFNDSISFKYSMGVNDSISFKYSSFKAWVLMIALVLSIAWGISYKYSGY